MGYHIGLNYFKLNSKRQTLGAFLNFTHHAPDPAGVPFIEEPESTTGHLNMFEVFPSARFIISETKDSVTTFFFFIGIGAAYIQKEVTATGGLYGGSFTYTDYEDNIKPGAVLGIIFRFRKMIDLNIAFKNLTGEKICFLIGLNIVIGEHLNFGYTQLK